MGCEVASMYVAPTDGGYRRTGHVCAYQRGYNDGRRGLNERWREKEGHRVAYEAGYRLGWEYRVRGGV